MVQFIKHFAICIAAVSFWSCDEGRIYENIVAESREGLTARLSVTVMGESQWPEGYSLALAGFTGGNEYALISKNIIPGDDGKCEALLQGIPLNTSSVALCEIDRLRRRVATFAEVSCESLSDTLTISMERIDVSPSAAIQNEIFNTTCVNCHGGANFMAAGLNLMEGVSFGELVGMQSSKKPGMARVSPYKSEESLLWLILSSDESASWSYDHSVEIVIQQRLELIRNWIDNGAKY